MCVGVCVLIITIVTSWQKESLSRPHSHGTWRCGSVKMDFYQILCFFSYSIVVSRSLLSSGLSIYSGCVFTAISRKDKVESKNVQSGRGIYIFFILAYLSYVQINRSIESLRHVIRIYKSCFSVPFSRYHILFFGLCLHINVLFSMLLSSTFVFPQWPATHSHTHIFSRRF